MALDYGAGSTYSVKMDGPYGSVKSIMKATEITVLANAWKGAVSHFSQTAEVEAASANSLIDLQPNAEQVVYLCGLGIALSVENDAGTITVHAFGNKPESDLTIQATVKEVTK